MLLDLLDELCPFKLGLMFCGFSLFLFVIDLREDFYQNIRRCLLFLGLIFCRGRPFTFWNRGSCLSSSFLPEPDRRVLLL